MLSFGREVASLWHWNARGSIHPPGRLGRAVVVEGAVVDFQNAKKGEGVWNEPKRSVNCQVVRAAVPLKNMPSS